MNLVIVESPSKAKTISKYLGKDYAVLASVGHVRDLPKSNKDAIDIDGGFVPRYVIDPKKASVIDDIRTAAAKADIIYVATDPDREGEAIAWHIAQLLTDKKLGGNKSAASKIKRITYHEVTKEAVLEALEHPRDIDEHLREAQEARRVLDRIVGYDLSGLIWKKVRYGLSAGRVQSPALRIIMEREREIRAFKPEDYWTIEGAWSLKPGVGRDKAEELKMSCSEEPRDKARADSILDAARSNPWHIVKIDESEVKRSPRAPFITSTLQQTASTRLGFSPSRTMGIAQKLYEAGHITYMRTDSTILSKQALGQIAGVIEKDYGKEYLQFRTYAGKSKNAQEAHEAIRPTHASVKNAGHNDEQKRLYRLIWQRAVASQMSDAKLARTKVIGTIMAEKESFPPFEATGSRIIFDGWLKADPESNGEEVLLPKCAEGEPLDLVSIDATAKQTQPPARYTEAGLIKELEKRGIGRPSTYATITKTIEDRGYVEKENRSLKPTDTGDVVSTFLEDNFPSYIGDDFTADMENQLDDIATGKRPYAKTLGDFYKPFIKEIKAKDKLDKVTNLGEADPKFKCPKCGSSMIIKLGRGGRFLSCSRYPDCDGALTIEGHEFKKDEPIGNDPATGLPIFVLNGRFGPYVQLGQEVKGQKSKIKTETSKAKIKAKKASIPKGKDPSTVTVADAMKYLSLPRVLGSDPETGKDITASIGRFGPYIVRDGDFRSLKGGDSPYDIALERALAILAEPKKTRGFARKKLAK
ncbi:MAG: type I DNA topoisomerase [Patescibacteria group bacterium]|nr:type I DNA topoisomerase [Patescibacteria group bacterium]